MIKLTGGLPGGVRAIVRDRIGRPVTLTDERWDHITLGHPEMRGLELAVSTAIETAEDRLDGNREGVDRLFAENLGPARWLVIVVEYTEGKGRVLTAYPSNKGPLSQNRSS